MLYVDYSFDITEGGIVLDDDMRLAGSINESKPWGTLPANWKEGDKFELVLGKDGRVILKRIAV